MQHGRYRLDGAMQRAPQCAGGQMEQLRCCTSKGRAASVCPHCAGMQGGRGYEMLERAHQIDQIERCVQCIGCSAIWAVASGGLYARPGAQQAGQLRKWAFGIFMPEAEKLVLPRTHQARRLMSRCVAPQQFVAAASAQEGRGLAQHVS